MKKLARDKVISIVNGKDLVGVYFTDTPDKIIMEVSPKYADKVIKTYNELNNKEN